MTINLSLYKPHSLAIINLMTTTIQSKLQAMLLGLAVGDALGAPVEHGHTSGEITARANELRHMHDEAQFKKGVWTDDTSMALCLADSLLECSGYDSWNVMDKYVQWMQEGYRSYFDYGEGIGIQTAGMLDEFAEGEALIHKDRERSDSAGNGTIMRLAPVVIAAHERTDIKTIQHLAKLSARETHYSYEAEAATEIFAVLLYNAIHEQDKQRIVDVAKYSSGQYYDSALAKLLPLPDIGRLNDRQGYVIYTLQIALWGFLNYDTFEDGMIAVMCLGGDVDTTMAVYGQLAGAYYGREAIPEEWQRDVYLGDEIIELAGKLAAMRKCPVLHTRFEEDI